MAHHDAKSASPSAPTGTSSGPQCVAIMHYFSCSCRSPHPIYFCRDPKCRHERPQLHISALPFACSSKQVENNRFWHYANKTRANRSRACSAEDPALSAFAREEDTAPALGDDEILVLGPLEGLCADNLGQVVPPYAEDWREKVVAKYEDFRDTVAGTSKDAGVIGEKRPARTPVEKLESKELAEHAQPVERVEEAQASVEVSSVKIPTPGEAGVEVPADNGSTISRSSSPDLTLAGTPSETPSRVSLDIPAETTLRTSEPPKAGEPSPREYSPIVDDDDDDVVGFLLDDEDDYYVKPKVTPPPAARGILGRMLSGLWSSV